MDENAYILDVAALDKGRTRQIDLSFDAQWADAAKQLLDITGLAKVRLQGSLAPSSSANWEFSGHIGATVTQACVLTLEPVRTRIEEDFRRLYVAQISLPDEENMEFLGDEDEEELGDVIDLGILAQELIALNLPPYPRADGAELEQTLVGPPGAKPLSDEDVKPFAALAQMREKMRKDEE